MTSIKLTCLFLLLLAAISCEKNHVTDEKVLSDILPEIIDSLGIRITNNLISPPSPPGFNVDSIEELFKKKEEQFLRRIDSVDARLLIGLFDTCLPIDFSDLLNRDFPDSLFIRHILENNHGSDSVTRKWDLTLIAVPYDYELIRVSDLENKYSDIWNITDRRFGGIILISKIYYDRNKETALLEFVTVQSRSDNAFSDYVLLERIDNKWRVKRILMNWIT